MEVESVPESELAVEAEPVVETKAVVDEKATEMKSVVETEEPMKEEENNVAVESVTEPVIDEETVPVRHKCVYFLKFSY